MENFDSISDQQLHPGNSEKRNFIEQQDRNGFIKKVYGIVTMQLVFTALFCTLPFAS